MTSVENYIRKLSAEELRQAFDEIEEFGNKGILKNGIIRDVNRKIETELKLPYGIDYVKKDILYEIAYRLFKTSDFKNMNQA